MSKLTSSWTITSSTIINLVLNLMFQREVEAEADLKRPSISAGISLKDWNFFKQEWERYKTDSHDPDPGRTLNQLLECLDKALRKHMGSIVGDRLKTIKEVDLLLEIEKLVALL